MREGDGAPDWAHHENEKKDQKGQSLGCAGTECIAASYPVPRSLLSEPKTVLPVPNSPLFPCGVALSLPPCHVLPNLGAAGGEHVGNRSHWWLIPKLVFGDHYSDEFHRWCYSCQCVLSTECSAITLSAVYRVLFVPQLIAPPNKSEQTCQN